MRDPCYQVGWKKIKIILTCYEDEIKNWDHVNLFSLS